MDITAFMYVPSSRTMASQSASSKRPLPKIVENKGTPANFNDDGDSDSGGRRHISSSVPRTTLAHGAEKMAMTKIKKKMTFSDHSVSWCPITPCSRLNHYC